MTRVQVVFMDVGGVLLDTGPTPLRERWAARLGLSVQELNQAVWDSIGSRDGRDVQEVAERIAHRLGLPRASGLQLLRDHSAHWSRNETLMAFLQSVARSVRLAILSNIPPGGRFSLETVLQLHVLFEAMFLSGELSVEKPESRIYEIACDRMGVDASAAAFVDDRPENVESALALGMAAHRHTTNEDTISWLAGQLGFET